jgi:hypothetical protein
VLKAMAGPLAAVGLLLSAQGCGTTASATTSSSGPSQASAMKVFDSYVTAAKVALADHNELLALSLTTSAEYSMMSAAFTTATASGAALPIPLYGRPTLYVPKVTTFPQWFVATAPEHPATGGPSRTALMVFDRAYAGATWELAGSVLLDAGAPGPGVATDRAGYATALSTADQTPKVRPDIVGPMHATVADDGPSSAATAAVAAGPQTTGLYAANAAIGRQATARHESYQWQMQGTSYPVFALRTTDGGALVFYTMYLNTQTAPAKAPPRNSKAPLPVIPVPAAYQALLPAKQAAIHRQLTANQTLSYVALDPPASARAAKIQVIGAGGGPTYAHGY